MRQILSVSERRVCRILGQHRSTQRKVPIGLPDEERLTDDIIALTEEFGRYALPPPFRASLMRCRGSGTGYCAAIW